MPTLNALRTTVDNALANLWNNQVQPRQALYAASHNGRYWQGLITTSFAALPDNASGAGVPTVQIVPTLRTPSDQAADWPTFGLNLGATLPMALAIDVYDGPLGTGYVGSCFVRWSGNVYARWQNFGPEDWRTLPWLQLQ